MLQSLPSIDLPSIEDKTNHTAQDYIEMLENFSINFTITTKSSKST